MAKIKIFLHEKMCGNFPIYGIASVLSFFVRSYVHLYIVYLPAGDMIAIEISVFLKEARGSEEGGGERGTARTPPQEVVAVVALEAEVKGEIGVAKGGRIEETGEEGERVAGGPRTPTGQS